MTQKTIALDAMGGDHGPPVTVAAARRALEEIDDIELVLVGDEARLRRQLEQQGQTVSAAVPFMFIPTFPLSHSCTKRKPDGPEGPSGSYIRRFRERAVAIAAARESANSAGSRHRGSATTGCPGAGRRRSRPVLIRLQWQIQLWATPAQ